jgi:tetratricopeptide (TPR) repeat protein/tRNA A-37 threonylcarbamoyl transferase component Bud32
MSGPAKNSRGSESGRVGRIADAVRQFESAWQRSLSGEPPPTIELFVAAAEEADRDLLRENLLQFEHQWRNRQEQATIDPMSAVSALGDTNSGAPAATIELPPQDGPSEGSLTAGHREASDQAPHHPAPLAATLPPALPAPLSSQDQGATLDLPAGTGSPGIGRSASIAPAAGADAATGVWDPNSTSQQANANLAFTLDAAASTRRAKAESSRPNVPGYELLSELGRGGMGIVYKAVHTKLHRVVALKMVLAGAHANPDQLARFATEAEAVAALQHPNIVQIYEIGEQNGLPFFSLEFVDGQPLDKRLAGKPQPPREAAKLMEPIARAMYFAHERGIVHRDLKPANVLLTRDSVPKVTDFGLAKKLESDSSQTKDGTLMGTPSYMAPEQAAGHVQQIGPASDIHSLGAMLYEMLVGRPPYLGATPLETMLQVKLNEPVPPRKLMPKLSRDIETICLKCLQKEPSRRYDNAGELADDLARFQKGEPIHARPISKPERAWRWCRRNPRIAALSAAVVMLVATAGVAMGKLAIDASQERQASEETRKLAEQRLEQATKAISTGDYRRAQDLLRGRDVRLRTAPELADACQKWQTLQDQVEAYADFKRLLADAHFTGLAGNRDDQLKARETLQGLIQLYEEIRDRTGRGAAGLPPLNPEQQRLFKENEFEAFLLAEFTEYNLFGESKDAKQRTEALERAIGWLNEAEKILPKTRALYVQRSVLLEGLGNRDAAKADFERAQTIDPTSAIDHFWHGIAELMRAGGASADGDVEKAKEFRRNAIAQYAAVLRLNPRDFWGFTQWAVCHSQLEEFTDAVVGFTAAIEIDPDHAMAYVNRAIAQLKLGQTDDALADLAAALAIDAHCAEAFFNRALVAIQRNDMDVALKDLKNAIEAKPHYEEAWFRRAELYRQLQRPDDALADYAHLIEIAGDATFPRLRRAGFLLELGRKQEALEDFEAVLKQDPANRQARWSRSAVLADLNRTEDAVADLDELLQNVPDDVESLTRRAELNRKLKRNEAALADHTRLVELAHDLATNYRRRADLYREIGRPIDAIADYGEVVKLKPGDANAWLQRALLEYGAGQHAAARDDATKVIELAPQAAPPYQIRALTNMLTFKEYELALADWRKLAELNPKEVMANYCVGIIEMGSRRYPPALTALEKAIELKPDHVDAHWARAQTLLFQKRYDEALAEINLLVEKLAPNRPATLNSRGDIYRAMRRPGDAAADYRTFFIQRPAQPDSEYIQAAINATVSLAGLLELQGKSDEAVACYEELITGNPASAAALLERAQFRRNHGRFDEALADCDAAATLDPKSALPGLARASIVAARGDHLAAVAEAENLLAGAPAHDGHVLWAAARVWSLASAAAQASGSGTAQTELAEKYADRAAGLLADALVRGFHDLIYPEHNRLALDPALAAVRRHPQVQELLGD